MPDNSQPNNGLQQLPPLPIQGGPAPTPATPDAPVNGVLNFMKALGNFVGGPSHHEKMHMQDESRAEATAIAGQEATMGQAPDTAAFVAAGGNPNVAQMFSEYAHQTAANNAKYSTMIDAMPGLSDQTKALMKMSLNNPASAELVKNVMNDQMQQFKAQMANVGRAITAQATEKSAQTRAGAEIGAAKIRGGAEVQSAKIRAGAEEYSANARIAAARISAAAKGGGSVAKAQKAAETAYKQVISIDNNGKQHTELLNNYNNEVINSMPFADAMNSYGFMVQNDDGDRVPLDQPGITGLATASFKDPKSAEGFLNTFKTDISKMSDPRAVASAMDAHLQEAVARGKIDPKNRDNMMQQILAAVQMALQNQQQQANEAVSTGSAFVLPDEEKSEDQAKDESGSDDDSDTGP